MNAYGIFQIVDKFIKVIVSQKKDNIFLSGNPGKFQGL